MGQGLALLAAGACALPAQQQQQPLMSSSQGCDVVSLVLLLRGLALANGVPITLELAKQALADGRPAEAAGAAAQPTIQQIIDAVTKYYDIKLSDLMSKRRHKSIALPRQVCMWLARKHTRFSLEEIGGYFGGRDHTTVMHAVRTVSTRSQNDPALGSDVARLTEPAGRLSIADGSRAGTEVAIGRVVWFEGIRGPWPRHRGEAVIAFRRPSNPN